VDYSKNEFWDFGKTGNTNWSGHSSDYCGACGSKSSAFNVYKTNITNFSNIDFSKYENVSLTIYVKAGTNNGTNSYTVKLIDANGNQVSTYTSTKTSGMGNGTNSSSAKESSVSFNPTTSFNGYKIEFPAKAFITQTRYVLTYDDKVASYTVTWTINPAAGGTLSEPSGNSTTVTPNAAYTYDFPAYTVSGSASVSQNGNTFTATPTANSTIQINMVQKTRADITFENMGSPAPATTGYYVGDTYTLPSENDFTCGDKTFVGWSTVAIDNSVNKPTTNFYEPGASVTLAASQKFYAVFAETVGTPTTSWPKTDVSDLKDGDEVVIVMNNSSNYAMTNDNGTVTAPDALLAKIKNDCLEDLPVSETIIWVLGKNSSNLTFYKDNTKKAWLYCTNTNNGVRVGTNANKVFTLDTSNGYLKNTGTSRYIGIYNSQDWRCYTSTSSNIGNQTLAFY
jgi:hypothetical protein